MRYSSRDFREKKNEKINERRKISGEADGRKNWHRENVRELEKEVAGGVKRLWAQMRESLSLDSRCEYMASVSSVPDSANYFCQMLWMSYRPLDGWQNWLLFCSVFCFLVVTAHSAGCSHQIMGDLLLIMRSAFWQTSEKWNTIWKSFWMSKGRLVYLGLVDVAYFPNGDQSDPRKGKIEESHRINRKRLLLVSGRILDNLPYLAGLHFPWGISLTDLWIPFEHWYPVILWNGTMKEG